ncbi:unnamed protein product [Aphanomyces euteiches]|uniref:Serine aminopeptidase S33 domain-containing protein n=1 Tax=Aphanomyces euteiches TaxID=100861 RepID=A0A6G0XNB1_9STRA|nr:hypothetical protein Ae201684_003075 [Aphanomyces euteiches]KAH9098220.1 hypothetical protein Ae201684P_017437 [Aphanomyces euteiches]KAH9139709.1 hypothetical protein AeRB84_016013 [Aphanomyces euteiches]
MLQSTVRDISKQEKTCRLANGYDIYYVVYGPADASTTFVMIHGAAGSHNDFKYMAPLLVDLKVRVVAFDVPGNGNTCAEAAGGIALSDQSIVDALKEALENIEETSSGNYFVAGQSAGGSTAIQIAAQARGVQGLAVMNSIGLRPHRLFRPYPVFLFVTWMLRASNWTRFLASRLTHFFLVTINSVLPKKTSLDTVAYSQQRMGTISFERLKENVDQVKAKHMPTFVANTANDRVIEKELSRELAQAFGSTAVHMEYPSGGHMIQKTQAKALSEALVAWSESILAPRPKL